MQDFIIYPLRNSDFEEIILIWEASVRATHHFLNEDDIQTYKTLIFNEYLNQVELYGIKTGAEMLGFIGLSEDLIQMLFIHPNAFGKGLGKALLTFATKEKHCTMVDVNEQNKQALNFYYHFGFSTKERFDHDAAGKPYPILSLSL